MESISGDVIGSFGVAMAEAVEVLVDDHDLQHDKRAAMLSVESPTLTETGAGIRFTFSVSGTRQKPVPVALEILPCEGADLFSLVDCELVCEPSCSCVGFSRDGQCAHTLAASWWLQEQLGRRTIEELVEFFGTLEVDAVSEGRQLVDELLRISDESNVEPEAGPPTRVQWRISLSGSRFYSPISIRAFEQRPRKNGKGWTKGKELRSYDLLRRDFRDCPSDGQVAALAASPSYSFDDEHFDEFRALQMLAGHPNLAWDDADAEPLAVHAAELSLRLRPVKVDAEETGEEPGDDSGDVSYRPELVVSGLNLQPNDCEIVLGYSSPVEPVVVLADRDNSRIVVCTLRDPRGTRLVRYLLGKNLEDVVLDADSAARLAVQGQSVDSLIQVELPDELAGPVVPATAEAVIELRPRPGGGLELALRVHDERFRQLPTPAEPPEIVPCLTPNGPVRLKRDLEAERERSAEIVERFGLRELVEETDSRWVAETDAAALDVLSRLHEAGDQAPRLLWPEGETLRVRGELTPASLRVQLEDRRDWFGMQGAISVDGQEIPLSRLLEAVRENRALVRIGDREFAKISESFRRRLEQLGDAVVQDRGSLKVADAAVPAVQELIGDDIPLQATQRWHESIRRLQSLKDWSPDKPEDLEAELRDYQLEGYRWLARLSRWGVGGVLADDMGLGKTVQTLGVLIERGGEGPALVVAPTSVGENWVRETERFAPSLKPHLYRESDRQQLIDSAAANDVVIVSYQLVQRDAKRFASRSWNTLVLDEAQFIKNSQTKTSQAIRKIDANWRVGLSGTPLENHLGELWSLFRTLSPGLLGSWERFRTRFAEPIERQRDEKRRESLARLVRPFILRRTKDKVLRELPPRTEITWQAELSRAERKLYEDARLAAVAELSGLEGDTGKEGDKRIRTLAWLTRLRQLACHPALVDPSWKKSSAKLDLLMSLVEELREGEHRALVFSQFVKHLGVIRRRLDAEGIRYQYLDGATPSKERQRRVDAFQGGEGELFLISLKAGGTGLNLTAADYVIHLDPWWNPAVEDQATDRAHRIGQDRPVTVYRLVAEGTIEEQILQMHAEKRELVAGVLDGTDRAGRMGTEELIELIKQGTLS